MRQARRIGRAISRIWPALVLALLAAALQALGWSEILHNSVRGLRFVIAWAWPILRLLWPSALVLLIAWLVVRERRRQRERSFRVRSFWLIVVFAALILTLAIGSILIIPGYLVDRRTTTTDGAELSTEQRLKAENDVRTTLLQAIAGLLLAVGAATTWRQIHISREGQITERFSKAIDHLGQTADDKLDMRLGGIFALERIANNSPDDRATIGEVLTAYVREHSPWPPSRPGQYRAAVSRDQVPTLQARAGDIQAVLVVLGRRALPPSGPTVLDLSNTDLRRMELPRVNLRRAKLQDGMLQDANLQFADLQGANLRNVNFEGASLRYANLEDADLTYANLRSVGLVEANLRGAILRGISLEGGLLSGANLEGVRVSGSLKRADLTGARLRDADLMGVDLQDATLVGVQLQGADLTGANLQGSRLMGARCRGTTLVGANLSGADLAGANLRKATYNRGPQGTIWPAGFSYEAAHVQLQNEES